MTAARLDEITGLYQHGVYETVDIAECWETTGKAPIRVRWLDMNNGDEKIRGYNSRLVAQEIKMDNREDLFAATPPLQATKLLFSLAVAAGVGYEEGAREHGMKPDLVDIRKAFLHADARREKYMSNCPRRIIQVESMVNRRSNHMVPEMLLKTKWMRVSKPWSRWALEEEQRPLARSGTPGEKYEQGYMETTSQQWAMKNS